MKTFTLIVGIVGLCCVSVYPLSGQAQAQAQDTAKCTSWGEQTVSCYKKVSLKSLETEAESITCQNTEQYKYQFKNIQLKKSKWIYCFKEPFYKTQGKITYNCSNWDTKKHTISFSWNCEKE